MKNLKDSKRLENLIEVLATTPHKLSLDIGYKAPASVYHVLNGINKLSSGMRERILKRYPNVNPEFLKRGELPIVFSKNELLEQNSLLNLKNKDEEFVKSIISFIEIPKKLDRIIELLESEK